MKKKILFFLVTAILMFAIVGCSQSNEQKSTSGETTSTSSTESSEKTTDSGEAEETLVMGLDDTFAPMGFKDKTSGELVGFDIDLANAVAKKIGKTIEFQSIDWSMKENELNAGNIDMIWNGYSITDERKEVVAFSDPYLDNRQIIIVLADSPINTKADLKDKTVAIQAESSAITAVKAEEGFIDTLKNKELVEFSTNNEAFSDLEAGRSDAVVADETLARYYIHEKGDDKYKTLEENFGAEEFGIGFRKDDTELVNAVNEALKELKADGTYDEIYSKWFSTN